MELARNPLTGAFPTYNNTAAATIGLQSYLATWPTNVVFVDNTLDNSTYCAYVVLDEGDDGDYFVASDLATGYRTTIPVLGACAPN